jgi:histidyl-tRNA synthetase
VNNRKVLDGVMEAIGLTAMRTQKLTVLRAIDKLDKFGIEGVKLLLLGEGRKDESGDFTKGAGLDAWTNCRRFWLTFRRLWAKESTATKAPENSALIRGARCVVRVTSG